MGIKESWLTVLPEQFKGKFFLSVLIGAFARQLDEIEAMFHELIHLRGFDTAAGTQLDNIGDIVVLSRPQSALYAGVIDFDVIDDERYRLFLKYKAMRNSSRCTFPELVAACKLLYGAVSVYYREDEAYPATFFLNIGARFSPEVLALFQNTQLTIKAAGVSANVGYFNTEFFGFSDTNRLARGFGMGQFAQQIITGGAEVKDIGT